MFGMSNLMLNDKELVGKLRGKFSICTLNVELTNICNLRCPLCVTGAGQNKTRQGLMDLEKFKKFMDRCAPLFDKVDFIGAGEPQINPFFLDFVEYVAKEKNIRVSSCTNGQIIKDPEAIVNSGLNTIFIDIDGLTPEQHSIYRIGSNLKQVLENVKRLIDAKEKLYSYFPEIVMDTLITSHNEKDYEKFISFARELGVNGIRFRSIHNTVSSDPDWLPTLPQYQNVKIDKPAECVFQNHITGLLSWNGDLHLCCMTSYHENGLTKFNAFEENKLLEKMNSDNFYKITKSAGNHAFCRDCVFVNYELFSENIEFNKPLERTWHYWWGKYGRNPKRLGKALSEKAKNLYNRLNIRH